MGEGTTVWRPVDAENIEGNVYKISTDSDPAELEEEWAFQPGDLVLCERHVFSGGSEGVIAVKRFGGV